MRNIFLALFIICATAPLGAQNTSGDPNSQKALQETGRMLSQAQSSARSESARQSSDRAADKGRLDQLAAEAPGMLSKASVDNNASVVDAVDKKLAPALRSAAPEGRVIIAQSAASPAMRAPDPDAPTGTVPLKKPPGASTPAGKKGTETNAPPGDINIRSEGAVYLDSVQALAIFTDDVVLDHPTFHMTSDKLEVYFVKEPSQQPAPVKAVPVNNSVSGTPVKALPVESAAPQSAAPQSGDTKLKQAIATGRKVVIHKLDENGEPQIGICRHLTYIGESGDVILREMPQVQRGNNVIIAREPSTYMVMKQNGELKVHGPADTKIQQKSDSTAKPKTPAADPAVAVPGTVPGTPVLTPKKTAKK